MGSVLDGRAVRVGIYARVSTAGQADDGTSLDTQADACRNYAEARGWTIAGEWSDVFSGAALHERPGLSALREAVRAGSVTTVLAYAVDRLGRSQAHVSIILDELERHGVTFECVTEKFEDTAVGRFLLSARSFVAEVEREKIGERTLRGKWQAARDGRLQAGTTAFGFSYTRATKGRPGTVEAHPEQADVVRRIFRWYVEDRLSQHAIAQRLTDEGVPAPTHGTKGGIRWYPGTIARMLGNPSYMGRHEAFRWQRSPTTKGSLPRPPEQRIRIDGAFPPLVDAGTWEAAQVRKGTNAANASRNMKREYLLTWHVICGSCRRRYRANTVKGTWSYYSCPAARLTTRSERCRNRRVAGPALENEVWGRVSAALSDPEIVTVELDRRRQAARAGSATYEDLRRVEEALARLGAREARLVKLYTYGEIDDAMVQAQGGEVKAERARLEAERERLANRVAADAQAVADLEGVAPFLERVRRDLGTLDHAGKRLALEALGVVVTIDEEGCRVEASIPLGEPMPVAIAPRSSARL